MLRVFRGFMGFMGFVGLLGFLVVVWVSRGFWFRGFRGLRVLGCKV